MQYSVVMLVSRDDFKLLRAVESVKRVAPDEFRCYIDYSAVNKDKVDRILKDAGAEAYPQEFDPSLNHHENVAHNLHRAIIEANNEWVIKIDDDDELIGRRRDFQVNDKVGVIHGDKIVRYPYFAYLKSGQLVELAKAIIKPTVIRGGSPSNHRDISGKFFLSASLINRNAFAQVHHLIDHGYFCDYKIIYWILRAGWNSLYVPQIMFCQYVNPNVGQTRKRLWGKWFQIAEQLDKIPLEVPV